MKALLNAILNCGSLPVELVTELHGAQSLQGLIEYVETNLPLSALDARNQPYVVIKSISLIKNKEFQAARELLASCAMFHSQDSVIQHLQYVIEQNMRPEDIRNMYDVSIRFCSSPFQRLDVVGDMLDAYLCCMSFLPHSVGSLLREDGWDVWNSARATRIRQTILDGTYAYCNKITCPAIGGMALPLTKDIDVAAWTGGVARGPRRLNLSYDRTCNLYCPSCRRERVVEPPWKQRQYIDLFERKIRPLMQNVEYMEVTGSGDPFASASMWHVLQTVASGFPSLRTLHIMTNLQLFIPRKFEALAGLHGRSQFYVSVDAACPETYAQLRRGGDFHRLLPKLEYLGQLRRDKVIKHLMLAFVVQRGNYKEIPDFIRLGKKVGADIMQLTRMTNWGSFTDEAYAAQCVWNVTHPEHGAFLDVMADPILHDPMLAQSDLWVFRGLAPGKICPGMK